MSQHVLLELVRVCARVVALLASKIFGLVESQEGGVLDAGKAARKYLCAWHQHTGREGVLVHGVAPEQEEAEQVSGDCVHFLKDNFFCEH